MKNKQEIYEKLYKKILPKVKTYLRNGLDAGTLPYETIQTLNSSIEYAAEFIDLVQHYFNEYRSEKDDVYRTILDIELFYEMCSRIIVRRIKRLPQSEESMQKDLAGLMKFEIDFIDSFLETCKE